MNKMDKCINGEVNGLSQTPLRPTYNQEKEDTPTYKGGIRVKAQDKFIQGGLHYERIDQTKTVYLYEVTHESGSAHYEIVKRGHLYKGNPLRPSTVISDGDEMYPSDNDFGFWAWCYNDKESALRNISRLAVKGL